MVTGLPAVLLSCRASGAAPGAQEKEEQGQGGHSRLIIASAPMCCLSGQYACALAWYLAASRQLQPCLPQCPHQLWFARFCVQAVRWAEDVVDNEFMNKKKSKSE